MKSKEVSVLVLSTLIVLPFFVGQSFSQESNITITTEKESYSHGESIRILGFIEKEVDDNKIILRVFNSLNTLVVVEESELNDDGTFEVEIPTSITSPQWKKDGTYTIFANYYGSESVQTQFEYGIISSAGVKTEMPEISMNEEDALNSIMLEDYNLTYGLNGAEIIRITPDPENKSLIIEIKTFSDGELRITLPNDVIDTDEEGFFILVDGEETYHDAVLNSDNWSFVIPFSHGSEEIEIIGTYVIPEFGTITVLILMASISALIIISARSKQIFYLRT